MRKDVVARFVKVTQPAYQECVRSPDPCAKALVHQVRGLKIANETVNWKLTMQLTSNEFSRTKGLGFMDPTRMRNGYDLVTKYLGRHHAVRYWGHVYRCVPRPRRSVLQALRPGAGALSIGEELHAVPIGARR